MWKSKNRLQNGLTVGRQEKLFSLFIRFALKICYGIKSKCVGGM